MTFEYRPDQYWEDRGGESYRAYTESADYRAVREAQEKFFAQLLRDLNPTSLLDFGCGSGKLFACWQRVPEVHAYDRSRSQLQVARRVSQELRPDRPYRIMYYLSDSRTEVPYDDNQFDLVVVSEVLMHVIKSEIADLVGELHRICRAMLCIIVPAPFRESSPHCFNHDYETVFAGLFQVTNDHVEHAQRYLVAKKLEGHDRRQDKSRHPEAATVAG